MKAPPSEETGVTAEDALKRRLLNRIAIAAVMVVGLLGSLAVFDAVYAPSRRPAKLAVPTAETSVAEVKPAEPLTNSLGTLSAVASVPTAVSGAAVENPKLAASPVAVAPAVAQLPPATSAATGKPLPRETGAGKTVAEGTMAQGAPILPASSTPAQATSRQPIPPLAAEPRLTKPATKQPASLRPSEPVSPSTSAAARPDPSRIIARKPGVPPRAPASRPLSRGDETQFALQMGVFNTLANAEDMRAMLELHGIPSSIEARVKVGPFATREEADAVRAKIKELGLDGGLLVTMKK